MQWTRVAELQAGLISRRQLEAMDVPRRLDWPAGVRVHRVAPPRTPSFSIAAWRSPRLPRPRSTAWAG